MGFENFAQKIKPLVNSETLEKPPLDEKRVPRFSLVWGRNGKKQ